MWNQAIAVLEFALFVSIEVCSDDDTEKGIKWAMDFIKKEQGSRKEGNFTLNNGYDNDIKDRKTCYTDEQDDGVCVKQSLCTKELPKIDPASLFTWRSRNSSETVCETYELCCPIDQLREPPKEPAPTNPGCGYSNPGAISFRNLQDDNTKKGYADFGEFGWMIALLKAGTKDWADENYLGGGTLIHHSVVMTAAHKLNNMKANELQCRAGEFETQHENEFHDHQDRLVKNIIKHKQYYHLHSHYNIALLILKEPFTMEPHIDVACLSPALPPVGTECFGMGWGEDFTKNKKYAKILKKIPLRLVKDSTCEMQYKNSRLGSGYTLHQSLTCAGGEAMVDTCMGDGGSSLVCPIGDPEDGRYQVVGMVAYGLGCGTANLPGVYVNVPYLYNWINQQMTLQGFGQSSYVY